MNKIVLAFVVFFVGCINNNSGRNLIKTSDNICINNSFYTVEDVASYPWVKVKSNKRCAENPNVPDTYVDFSKVESFEVDCTCRYSATCRKYCRTQLGDQEKCLESCAD